MNLQFEWQKPIVLYQNKKPVFTNDQIDEIKDIPGVYYFARMFGVRPTPFYIGESVNLRARLKSHLSTVKIVDVLRGTEAPADAMVIRQGKRVFYYAYFMAKPNQKPKPSINLAQKFMIREAISQGIPLINLHLTTIKAHAISFGGTKQFRGAFKGEKFWVCRRWRKSINDFALRVSRI